MWSSVQEYPWISRTLMYFVMFIAISPIITSLYTFTNFSGGILFQVGIASTLVSQTVSTNEHSCCILPSFANHSREEHKNTDVYFILPYISIYFNFHILSIHLLRVTPSDRCTFFLRDTPRTFPGVKALTRPQDPSSWGIPRAGWFPDVSWMIYGYIFQETRNINIWKWMQKKR